MIRKIQLVA